MTGAPAVLWLTGLPGAGKTTLARALHAALRAQQLASHVVDGDELRQGLCADLGFAPADRRENIRRAGELCRVLVDAGLWAIAAFVSPYRADRDALRARLAPGQFIEVHVDCDLATCEQRDPKGLYQKARAGLLKDFTGIDAPYEEPLEPDVVVATASATVDACVERILRHLGERASLR